MWHAPPFLAAALEPARMIARRAHTLSLSRARRVASVVLIDRDGNITVESISTQILSLVWLRPNGSRVVGAAAREAAAREAGGGILIMAFKRDLARTKLENEADTDDYKFVIDAAGNWIKCYRLADNKVGRGGGCESQWARWHRLEQPPL